MSSKLPLAFCNDRRLSSTSLLTQRAALARSIGCPGACHGAHFGEGAVRAVLAMLAPKRALRVSLGGCAPLSPFVARHDRCIVRPGRESRRFYRTGKPVSRSRRLGQRVPLRIECDRRDWRPVAGSAAPSPRVGLTGTLVKFVPGGEHGAVLTGMALRRCH